MVVAVLATTPDLRDQLVGSKNGRKHVAKHIARAKMQPPETIPDSMDHGVDLD